MIATMTALVTLQMGQDFVLIVQIPLTTAPETAVMCTKVLMLRESERKKGTTVHLVKENVNVKLREGLTTTEDPLRTNLKGLVIGLSTSVPRERNIITIVNLKFHSGKNLVSGLIGKRIKNTNVTGKDIDVTETVIESGSMKDHILLELPVVLQIDIPVLIDLLCQIVTVVVVIATCRQLVRQRIGTTIEITNCNILFPSQLSLEGIVMVSTFLKLYVRLFVLVRGKCYLIYRFCSSKFFCLVKC